MSGAPPPCIGSASQPPLILAQTRVSEIGVSSCNSRSGHSMCDSLPMTSLMLNKKLRYSRSVSLSEEPEIKEFVADPAEHEMDPFYPCGDDESDLSDLSDCQACPGDPW
ncbi:unnamed protein product [Effrenium voratum]|nr:unnamed protein product [Effrenium voratum]